MMDFVILKVNGVDVSDCSHEEAVKIFLAAQEPIVVEVNRRDNMIIVNAEKHDDENSEEKVQPSCQNKKNIQQLFSSVSREVQTDLDTSNNCLQCSDYYGYSKDDNIIYPDFEYQEIVLKRLNPADRLGLTL